MSDQKKESKKEYETPKVEKVGNVAEVTQGVVAASTDNLVTGSQ